MVMIYPLSAREERTVRWATRIALALAVTLTVLLGSISVAAAAG